MNSSAWSMDFSPRLTNSASGIRIIGAGYGKRALLSPVWPRYTQVSHPLILLLGYLHRGLFQRDCERDSA
jgi:hypothetical protein